MSNKVSVLGGKKSYSSIGHLPGSRMGEGDRKCNPGQARIVTERPRDKFDNVVVQVKLDGSNVGVLKQDRRIYPITRAGYLAGNSSLLQHQLFAEWVYYHQARFDELLKEGERVCGEWLLQAHGTRYELKHEPFLAFDIITSGEKKLVYRDLCDRLKPLNFAMPHLIAAGDPISVEEVVAQLDYLFISGKTPHGELDPIEGAVWRSERFGMIEKSKNSPRHWVVDFLVKYVRPEKVDGIYLPGLSAGAAKPTWNKFVGDEWLKDRLTGYE